MKLDRRAALAWLREGPRADWPSWWFERWVICVCIVVQGSLVLAGVVIALAVR